MAHPNEDLIRQGYEAFGKGDMDTIRGLFADDIAWHAPGRSPLAGDYHGMDSVLAFFGKTLELSGGTFRLDLHDVVANDEHGVALVTATGQREGKTLDDRQAHVFHISDGKVTEFWNQAGDLYAVDEFWT